MAVPDTFNLDIPTRLAQHVGSKVVQSLEIRTRRMVEEKEKLFALRLQGTIEQMTEQACIALEKACKAGPKIGQQLNDKLDSPKLSLTDLESASRVWERTIKTSRTMLGLDATERDSVNVSLTVNQGPVLRSMDVIDVNTVNEQSVTDQPSAPAANNPPAATS